ncbi:signal peptidase I [Amnibacterium flavum]|uniref:Signal peptidase I n=1 Tax=Amnibacterium flavum TaxID=2173173 RepID=A0A2V1HVK1_9MICO|nr:signal peptidase I [Amnibacterium flavum]PVZ95109.1 signal peptidase I [Amnibacterium flavum]
MRTISIVRWIIVGVLTLALAIPALAVSVGGRLIVEVDGESMTPTYQVGDIILVREPTEADLVVGNVVTAIDGNGDYYTHRILTVNDDGSVSLKGDGNAAADPGSVTLDQLRGVVELHLGQPWAMLVIQLQQWPLRICLLAIILGFALLPLRSRRGGAAAPDAVPAAPAPAPVVEAAPAAIASAASTVVAAVAAPVAERTRRRSGGRRAAAPQPKSSRPRGARSAHADTATERTRGLFGFVKQSRRADAVDSEPVAFRSTYSAAEPTSSVETVPTAPAAEERDITRPQTGPVALADSAVTSVPVEASPFSPLSAALVAGQPGASYAATEFVLDVDLDDIDEVDNVANLVGVPAGVGAEAGISHSSGYSITVVDGLDGQPRVRISLDLDSSALAAALAVAAPSPSSASVTPMPVAPATAFAAPASAAVQHAAAGLAPVLEYAGTSDAAPLRRPRHGRRRAS